MSVGVVGAVRGVGVAAGDSNMQAKLETAKTSGATRSQVARPLWRGEIFLLGVLRIAFSFRVWSGREPRVVTAALSLRYSNVLSHHIGFQESVT